VKNVEKGNKMLPYSGYGLDDLLLVPKPSSVNSRDHVDLSVKFPSFELKMPIVASPMKGITSPDIIIKLGNLGGIGILHRFYKDENQWRKDLSYVADNCENFGVAIGLSDYKKFEEILLYSPKIICIDVANGYLHSVLKFVMLTKKIIGNKALIMVGNVVEGNGAHRLFIYGADIVRVGIGTGGLCTTRLVTGVGYPQLSAISLCLGEKLNKWLVADGGIRNSGDAVKCLAAGADLVMIGSLFGNCFEAEHDGTIFGMASQMLQEDYYHQTKSIEGISKVVQKNISVENFIKEFTDGMRSAFTYMNAENIESLRSNASWVKI